MEIEVKKRRAQMHKYQGAGLGISILGIVYLLCMVFGIDSYYAAWAFGRGISLMITVSIILVYALLEAVSFLIMRLGAVKISEILSVECDPFLYEACISRNSRIFYKNRILCNLALAEHYQGDYDRAWETLQQINPHKLKGVFKANYYILLSDQYFKRGMGMQVRGLEEEFRQRMKGKRDQWYFEMLCAGNNVTRALENQDYKSASEFLDTRMDLNKGASKPWMKVIGAYRKAQIFTGLGEQESAKLELQYVISRGNRMWCVQEAQKMLEGMR